MMTRKWKNSAKNTVVAYCPPTGSTRFLEENINLEFDANMFETD